MLNRRCLGIVFSVVLSVLLLHINSLAQLPTDIPHMPVSPPSQVSERATLYIFNAFNISWDTKSFSDFGISTAEQDQMKQTATRIYQLYYNEAGGKPVALGSTTTTPVLKIKADPKATCQQYGYLGVFKPASNEIGICLFTASGARNPYTKPGPTFTFILAHEMSHAWRGVGGGYGMFFRNYNYEEGIATAMGIWLLDRVLTDATERKRAHYGFSTDIQNDVNYAISKNIISLVREDFASQIFDSLYSGPWDGLYAQSNNIGQNYRQRLYDISGVTFGKLYLASSSFFKNLHNDILARLKGGTYPQFAGTAEAATGVYRTMASTAVGSVAIDGRTASNFLAAVPIIASNAVAQTSPILGEYLSTGTYDSENVTYLKKSASPVSSQTFQYITTIASPSIAITPSFSASNHKWGPAITLQRDTTTGSIGYHVKLGALPALLQTTASSAIIYGMTSLTSSSFTSKIPSRGLYSSWKSGGNVKFSNAFSEDAEVAVNGVRRKWTEYFEDRQALARGTLSQTRRRMGVVDTTGQATAYQVLCNDTLKATKQFSNNTSSTPSGQLLASPPALPGILKVSGEKIYYFPVYTAPFDCLGRLTLKVQIRTHATQTGDTSWYWSTRMADAGGIYTFDPKDALFWHEYSPIDKIDASQAASAKKVTYHSTRRISSCNLVCGTTVIKSFSVAQNGSYTLTGLPAHGSSCAFETTRSVYGATEKIRSAVFSW